MNDFYEALFGIFFLAASALAVTVLAAAMGAL
jgi:hypothetical protein